MVAAAFFYKKSLAGCFLICPTGSKRLNTSIVQLVGGQLLLIVYFPTDDGIKTILMKIGRAVNCTTI